MNLKIRQRLCAPLDWLYLTLDRTVILRTRNLRLMPDLARRLSPGRPSYGEWCHIVGIFQTLILGHLRRSTDNHVLDVGCGTGILAIASEPFLGEAGGYTGIDIKRADVEFCRAHYPRDRFSFEHLEVRNPTYAADQAAELKPWPIASASQDLVTSLSVWTHLNERDARFYFQEIDRVLQPGGRAIVTFYLLDELYQRGLPARGARRGKYNNIPLDQRIFDRPAYGSRHWFHPAWVKHPEDTIGVTPAGIEELLRSTSLRLTRSYPGNWKEVPGAFFQDVLVFEKDGGDPCTT
jgi:SAM-dependent methyltransferase